MSTTDPVAEFFSGWATYRAVIESDGMEHQEVYARVNEILRERSDAFTLLDVGCGDSAGTASALPGTHISTYIGVDIAAPALSFAAENFADVPFTVDLHVGDALAALVEPDAKVDVIVAAFVLHHFSSADKLSAIAGARKALRPGGEFLLIDVVRRDEESREDYLDRYEALVRTWGVTGEAQTGIIAHVRGYDFPEEISVERQWLDDAGFTSVEEFYRGGTGTQVGWRARL